MWLCSLIFFAFFGNCHIGTSRTNIFRRSRSTSSALLAIHDLDSLLCHLSLRAHFLQTRNKRFDLLLLARNGRFQSFDLVMLFQEFIQQHCVYGVVAHGLKFSVPPAFYEVRSRLLNFFGDASASRMPAIYVAVCAGCTTPNGSVTST